MMAADILREIGKVWENWWEEEGRSKLRWMEQSAAGREEGEQRKKTEELVFVPSSGGCQIYK